MNQAFDTESAFQCIDKTAATTECDSERKAPLDIAESLCQTLGGMAGEKIMVSETNRRAVTPLAQLPSVKRRNPVFVWHGHGGYMTCKAALGQVQWRLVCPSAGV